VRRAIDNRLAAAASELLRARSAMLCGQATDEFVDLVGRAHPARELYASATATALAGLDLPGITPEVAAAAVFRNFVWTHFVCKLLMTADPAEAIGAAAGRIDLSDLDRAIGSSGAAILSGFHYTGYPLVAMALAMSPLAPVISKARLDVIEDGDSGRLSDNVVYLSDRTSAIRLTRALRAGRSIWVLLDVVLPEVRVVRASFLGGGMSVAAGLGKIARLSGRPCVPLTWQWHAGRAVVSAAAPILPVDRSEGGLIDLFVDTQAEFIRRDPTQWLEWYSVLDDAPRIRAEVKRGNDEVWARLQPALEHTRMKTTGANRGATFDVGLRRGY
jgi:lauroyl/myristoyl acyltransferase